MSNSVWESLVPFLTCSSAEEAFLIAIKHFLENVEEWITPDDDDVHAVTLMPRFEVSMDFIASILGDIAKTYKVDEIQISPMGSDLKKVWIKISNHPTYAIAAAA